MVAGGVTKGFRNIKKVSKYAGAVGAIAGGFAGSINGDTEKKDVAIGMTQGALSYGFDTLEASVFGQNSSVNLVGKIMFSWSREVPDITLGLAGTVL